MLDLSYVRQNLEEVRLKIGRKGVVFDEKTFIDLDNRRRLLITQSEAQKSRKNSLAKEIGLRKKKGEDTGNMERETVTLSREIAGLEGKLSEVEREFNDFILSLPNLPLDSVPEGKDPSQNVVIREWGKKPEFPFTPVPHWELGESSHTLDFGRAVKIASSRFALSFGSMAKLERVLIQFMLETHTRENGYTEVVPPFLANTESLVGTGNLPKFKQDLFKVEDFDLYLVPTAEVPLTNIHRDEVLAEEEMPRKYVAYTPCFRSEAGSHGKDIRGIIRLHQFNKVELLKFTTPEASSDELEKLTADAESILKKLNLHYRVVSLCGGDLSFSSAKTYDLEVWMPARNGYMEISSCSNFTDFQSRRARIKYKTKAGKKEFAHTLNGSGLAIGRTVAAIMENFQEKDGRMSIPVCLKEYFPGEVHF